MVVPMSGAVVVYAFEAIPDTKPAVLMPMLSMMCVSAEIAVVASQKRKPCALTAAVPVEKLMPN